MKYKQFFITLIAVILVHVVFLLILNPHGSKKEETEAKKDKTPQVTEPPKETPQPPVTPPVLPPKEVTVKIAPYTPSHFVNAPKQLPKNVAVMTGNCDAGIAINLNTHQVLWSKNADSIHHIASITKMMTALVAVEKMHNSKGTITPDTKIQVTRAASKIGGRQVWLDPKESFTFQELLKATMLHSANDCAYLLAEYLGGSEANFVADMNARAKSLGLRSFTFINAHGLTDKGRENSASPRELAYLAEVLLDVPEITRWSGLKREFLRENNPEFIKKNKGKPTELHSSNSLLGTCKGVNGMKTGFTNKAGFSIVATCERDGVRVVVVTLGCKDRKSRDRLTAALINWVYTVK